MARIWHSVVVAVCALALSGCLHGVQARKDSTPQAAALPRLELKATVTVLDEETGKPIPDAWVLVAARITTDRPAPSGDVEAVAGARGITAQDGTAWINEVQGAYYPGQSKNGAWIVMEEARARRLGPRKITGIESGDIVVASPIYGFIHQPFAVEDDPAFQDWLKNDGKKEDYSGWIRKKAVRVNLPPVFIESKDLKKGLALTIKMRKPRDLDEWAKTISLDAFVDATWLAMSVDAGATEEDQRRLYWLFGRTLDQIGLRLGKMEHVQSFAVYLRDEAIKYYVGHRPNPEDQDGTIQLWLAQKALEVLPQDSIEVKEHIGAILKGVADEGKAPRWKNHFLDPTDPARGVTGADSALQWAALDADNPRNDWDWQDARRYYGAGDKAKAYEALGHVLRLLVNLAIPKYTQMQEATETEFESAVVALMKDQAGQLAPDYWWSTKEPTFAKTPRARFDDVAGRTVALGLEAGLGATNGRTESPALFGARKGFPPVIGQAAGLMRDFHQLMHRPRFAGPPKGGDGNRDPQAVRQSTSTDSARETSDQFGGMSMAAKSRGQTEVEPVEAKECVARHLPNLDRGSEEDRFKTLLSLDDELRTLGNRRIRPGNKTRGELAKALLRHYGQGPINTSAGRRARERVAEMLTAYGDDEVARPAVLRILEEGSERERNGILGKLGRPGALTGAEFYERVDDLSRRGIIRMAHRPIYLARIDSARALPGIIETVRMSSDKEAVLHAAWALQDNYRRPSDFSLILRRLKTLGLDKSYDSRGNGLFWINADLLEQHIRQATGDDLKAALEIVGQAPEVISANGIPVLQGKLTDVDPNIRALAAEALAAASERSGVDWLQVVRSLRDALEKEGAEPARRAMKEAIRRIEQLQRDWQKLKDRYRRQ